MRGAADGKKSWRLATIATFSLSGVFVALAVVPREAETPHVQRVALPPAIEECAADADCVLVDRIGCCECKSGGARWAINGARRDELRRFLKRSCRRRGVCLRLDTCQDDLVPTCAAGRCVAGPARG